MFKKLLAVLLALVSCIALLAGCGGDSDVDTDFQGGSNLALENYTAPDLTGVTINVYANENSDFDAEGSWAQKKVEEKLGVDIVYIELDSFTQQYMTMMAEGQVPDLTHNVSYNQTYDQLGNDGAYINIYHYLDMMPNVKAFLEDPANASDIKRFTVEEGVLYCLPLVSPEQTDPYVFLYRKDIFEKHGLTFPTNQEEFVQTLEKLKELYPDSYPFVLRNMNGNIQVAQSFGHLWGGSHVLQGNFNTVFTLDENGEYYMAQISNSYKEMAQFLNDLMDKGLMHPSCATMDTATWYEAFGSDTSFITFDKTDRLPMMNRTGQSLKEDFLVVAAEPFNFGSYAETTDVVTTTWADGIGSGTTYWYAIGNNANTANTIAYVDWLFSEEGKVLTNWGVEGESWEYDENGNRKFIDAFLDSHGGLLPSGLYQAGVVGYRLTEAYVAAQSETDIASMRLGQQFLGEDDPQHRLRYTDEEQLVYDTYALSLYNYAQTQWSKFLLGQRDFSEWDQVIEEMKAKYHYDDLMAIHESALARVLEENGMA